MFNLSNSEFAVNRGQAHGRLAVVCIRYLSGKEMRPPTGKMLFSNEVNKSEFADYACTAFSEHVAHADMSYHHELLQLLNGFLSSNTLTWIEYVSRTKSLQYLIRTGEDLSIYLKRFAKYQPPLGREVANIAGWATDLKRLAPKFGGVLLSSPRAIYYSIPPFCPPLSTIHQQFGRSAHGILLNDLSSRRWDDCISCIDYPESRIRALGYGDAVFAVGLASGKILLYNASSCQVERTLCHSQPVQFLAFNGGSELLVSCGIISLKLWNPRNGMEVWTRHFISPAIALSFELDTIVVITKSRRTLYLNCNDVTLNPETGCKEERISNELLLQKVPVKAVVSFDRILALMYEEGSIYLFDLNAGSSIGCCNRNTGETESSMPTQMTLPHDRSRGPLAVIYRDGCLVTYNPFTLEQEVTVVANAVSLASAPDGRTLAIGDSRGTVQLRDSLTLQLLSNVESYGFEPKSLAFSSDGLRLMGVRDYRLKVWEPAILYEQQMEDDERSLVASSSNSSICPRNAGEGIEGDITVIVPHPSRKAIFIGRTDGSVSVYESETGKQVAGLYTHEKDIVLLVCDCNVLVSADIGSSVMMSELEEDDEKKLTTTRRISESQSIGPVKQLLLSPDGTILLISAARSDVLWGTKTGKMMASMSSPPRTVWKWVSLPTEGSLILIVDTEIQVYDWERVSTRANAPYRRLSFAPGFIAEDIKVKNAAIDRQGSYLAVEYFRDVGTRTATAFQVLNTTDLIPSTQDSHQCQSGVASIPLFKSLSKRVKYFLGFHNSKLVFMDDHSWVCSIDPGTFAGTHYVRHFFVPYDFVIGNKGVVAVVMPSGDIALAKERELAVVRNGLKFAHLVEV